MENSEIETRLIRLSAYVGALESLLTAVVDHLPADGRAAVVSSFQKTGRTLNDLLPFEEFSDEEIEAFQDAERHLLALLSINKS